MIGVTTQDYASSTIVYDGLLLYITLCNSAIEANRFHSISEISWRKSHAASNRLSELTLEVDHDYKKHRWIVITDIRSGLFDRDSLFDPRQSNSFLLILPSG